LIYFSILSLNVLFHLVVFIQFGPHFFYCYFYFFLDFFLISSVNILFHLSFFYPYSVLILFIVFFLISCLTILFHLICISNLVVILLIAVFNFKWLRILLCDFLIIAFNGVILASLPWNDVDSKSDNIQVNEMDVDYISMYFKKNVKEFQWETKVLQKILKVSQIS